MSVPGPGAGERPSGVADDQAPLVSFVVLNWKDQAATARCAQSLRAVAGIERCEIIVVDNESTPASREALARIGGVRLVPLPDNRGFAGGMNAGIEAARGRFVALLNNDLVVERDWLSEGLRCLSSSGVGLVGGAAFPWDGGEHRGPNAGALATTLVDPVKGFAVLGPAPAEEGPVASIDGSNILAPTEVLRKLGGFDTDYFAYGEDVDLCARAWANGHSVVFSPAMKVWHRRGASSDRVPRQRSFWAARNQLFTVAKHFPEHVWRRTVLGITADNLAAALLGHRGGLRHPVEQRLSRQQRLGLGQAGLWAVVHYQRLVAKRAQARAARQHDEAYVERLRQFLARPG